MHRTAVDESSTLSAVSYDASLELLELEFRSGGIYRFFRVPVAEHAALLAAPSKGWHFNHYIRNRFTHQNLRTTHITA